MGLKTAEEVQDTIDLTPQADGSFGHDDPGHATMTTADIAGYKVKERAPVCTFYRAHKVCGMGPPSSGATTVQGVLGMLERFDLRGLGKDDPRSWIVILKDLLVAALTALLPWRK